MAVADSRFPARVRELARERAGFLYSFSSGTKEPTPTDIHRLGRLDSEINKFGIEQFGLTGKELETYIEEIEEFSHHEFKKKLAEKAKSGLVLKAGEDCSICLQGLNVGEKALILKCSHTFHKTCTSEWLGTKPNCPLCRSAVKFTS